MLAHFVDLCTVVFVVVDDLWRDLAPQFAHPGAQSLFSDSEVITVVLVGELLSWDKETQWLSFLRHNYPTLFPHLPERSRFNRRRRNLWLAINAVRQRLLEALGSAHEAWRIIDTLPIPVVGFGRAPQAKQWFGYGARFGKVIAKRWTFYGFKLHFMVTLQGVITDFVLVPANERDVSLVWDVIGAGHDLRLIGDKGYISERLRQELRCQRRIDLLTPPRQDQKQQLPRLVLQRLKRARRLIETVGSQLCDQFNIERNRAKTYWGLCARLYTKLAAHTLAIYLNRLFGLEPLQIAKLIQNN
jgi:hypothetical protein